MSVDPRAASGFSEAEVYERGRPGYPDGAGALIVRELGLDADSTVVDLAAGTGKLTTTLAPRVGSVIAVEPSAPMRDYLRRQYPGVSTREGTAESMSLPTGSADAAVVGEAFHWFDTRAAAAEIARVLRPRGGLALVWNRSDWAQAGHEWLAAFEALVQPLRDEAGAFPAERGAWEDDFETLGLFEPLTRTEIAHLHTLDPDRFVSLVASWTWIANLPAERRNPALAEIADLVDGLDEIQLRYRTEILWTLRRR